MENGTALALGHALLIGIVAGLRTMIAPAAVLFARHSFWWIVFAVLALIEMIGDLMPKAPARTAPAPLVLRCISGGACGYFVAGAIPWAGAISGLIGALIGTYGGYSIRRMLTKRAGLPDIPVALAEDVAAILLALVAIRY